MNTKTYKVRDYIYEPIVWLTAIILIGFVIGAGRVDELGIREGDVGIGESGKVIRALSVIIAGVCGLIFAISRKSFKYLFHGTTKYLFIYFLLCVASVTFSPIPLITLFKSFEILVVLLLMTLAYTNPNLYETSKKFIVSLLVIYVITVIGVYIQFAVFGSEGQRQLIGATPLFGFMLTSKYPGMVGNALGYLGALVAVFGVYIAEINREKNKNRVILGSVIFLIGFSVTFLSYTRSVLVFLFIALFIYYAYRKKYLINFVMIIAVIIPLFFAPVQDKIMEHMRRGDTDENIATLSGRTEMWSAVFDRRILKITIGGGYATGAKFMNYERTGQLLAQSNVHNGFLEVVMSVGLIGGVVWLVILGRVAIQYYSFYKKYRFRLTMQDRIFHIFMMSVLFLSLTRSMMNSTFVYLDYFYPVLMAFILYGDSLKQKSNSLAVGYQEASRREALDMQEKKPDLSRQQRSILHRKSGS